MVLVPLPLLSPTNKDRSALFSSGPSSRKLRVVFDASLGIEDDGAQQLHALAKHDGVEEFRYLGILDDGFGGEDFSGCGPGVPGVWARIDEPEARTNGTDGVVYWGPNLTSTPGIAALWGDAAQTARNSASDMSYPNLTPPEATHQRWRDVVALRAASAIHGDLFVTERPYLLLNSPFPNDEAVPCTPEQALQFIGMYLRVTGRPTYTCWLDGGKLTADSRWGFYTSAARGSVNVSSVIGPPSSGTEANAGFLPYAVIRYISGALWGRDDVHSVLNSSPLRNDGAAAHHLVGVVLVNLLAACDASAVLVNDLLTLGLKGQAVAWQSTTFTKQLKTKAPHVWQHFESMNGSKWVELLRLLRNTVHSVPLLPYVGAPTLSSPMAIAGQAKAAEMHKAMSELHSTSLDHAVWETPSHGTSLLPGPLVDVLAHEIAGILNAVMEGLRQELSLPSPGAATEPDTLETRRLAVCQSGL